MFLNQQIIIHSTDGVTEYTDAKSFIESLAGYMKIRTELPADLSMISVGTEAPDQQYQDIPWLELDANNNPIALRYYNGIAWEEVKPYQAVQGPYENLYIQYGTFSYNHIQSVVNTWVDSQTLQQNNGSVGKFLFPEQFKAATTVTVQITPNYSTIMRSEGVGHIEIESTFNEANVEAAIDNWINAERLGFQWALGTAVDYTGFNMMTKTQDIVAAGLPFSFNWMAMGEKA